MRKCYWFNQKVWLSINSQLEKKTELRSQLKWKGLVIKSICINCDCFRDLKSESIHTGKILQITRNKYKSAFCLWTNKVMFQETKNLQTNVLSTEYLLSLETPVPMFMKVFPYVNNKATFLKTSCHFLAVKVLLK